MTSLLGILIKCIGNTGGGGIRSNKHGLFPGGGNHEQRNWIGIGSQANLKSFYEQSEHVIERAPRHDIVLVIGDFNAKVGVEEEEAVCTFFKTWLFGMRNIRYRYIPVILYRHYQYADFLTLQLGRKSINMNIK